MNLQELISLGHHAQLITQQFLDIPDSSSLSPSADMDPVLAELGGGWDECVDRGSVDLRRSLSVPLSILITS